MFNSWIERARIDKSPDILKELGFKVIDESVHCERNPMPYVPSDWEYQNITFIGKDGAVLTVEKTVEIRGVKYSKRTLYFSDMVAARTLKN
jgi:hypothetical protein